MRLAIGSSRATNGAATSDAATSTYATVPSPTWAKGYGAWSSAAIGPAIDQTIAISAASPRASRVRAPATRATA